ncbi:hypothetical protein AAULH_14196, partial [Lactobacillus helveticus MTCC 5463]
TVLASEFDNVVGPPVVDLLSQLYSKAADFSSASLQQIVQADLTSLQPLVNTLEEIAFSKLSCFAISSMDPAINSINSGFSSAL